MGQPVALLPSPVPLVRRQSPKQDALGEAVGLHAHHEAREAQPPLAHGGLDDLLAAGSEKSLSVGQGTVRTFPPTPTDAPREEQAVSPVELGVVVHRRAPRGALVEEPLHHLGLE